MKYFATILLFFGLLCSPKAQLDLGFAYISKSCPGEVVDKTIYVENYSFGNEKCAFVFKGSNIPGLKAYYEDVELDSLIEIPFSSDALQIQIEFKIPDNIEGTEIYYSVKENEKSYNVSFPIFLATYTINRNHSYIQTLKSCTDNVNWALPFYGTITDIQITDITNGKNEIVVSTSYMITYKGNIITMPKDTKGIFSVSALGCHTSDSFTFEVNTLYKD